MIKSKSINEFMTAYQDIKYNFTEVFDRSNGKYARSVNKENSDSFMRSFPNLLDVGVMGHCIHGNSGLCVQSGVQCYQDGLGISKPNMTLSKYKIIIDECKGKVMQIALGGRGDPNKHKQFEQILQYTIENGIVPNYTTSGLGLTDKEVELTKKYCGAVAVSWYRSDYTLDAIQRFVDADCMTSIHYVLSESSIDEAHQRLSCNDFPKGINAVIFLLHKPVGLGEKSEVLKPSKKVKSFFELVDQMDFSFKIGFDSCTIPGIINYTSNIDKISIDTCEGGRYSAYVSSDMIMTPCSFDQVMEYGVSLENSSIQDVWQSNAFNRFRMHLENSCPNCVDRKTCYGGCPLAQEIVLCERK